MNKLKFISIIIIALSFFSCADSNDIEEIPLKLPDLKQTEWKGTLITKYRGEIDDRGKVNIIFFTEDRGNSRVVQYGKVQTRDFKYTKDDKLLTIEDASNSIYLHDLEGDWILTEIATNRLVLVQGFEGAYEQLVMELYKVE